MIDLDVVIKKLTNVKGAFILLCFVIFMVWRATRKSKKAGFKSNKRQSPPLWKRFPGNLLAKVPFLKSKGQGRLANSAVAINTPSSYMADAKETPSPTEFYAPEKTTLQQPPENTSIVVPRATQHAKWRPLIPVSQDFSVNPTSTATTLLNAHQPQESFSSTANVEFGVLAAGTESSATLRSRMGPDVFYNQSEMARQPSDAYDPTRRVVNRASALTSLSSGFGDGDIIVPVVVPPRPAAVLNQRRSGREAAAAAASHRASWMSSTQQNQQSRRDTVYSSYTLSSEDSPPRFRTLTSWVDQQTGRIRRVQQRDQKPPVPHIPGNPGVPGIHNPPDEPSFSMMMVDDEQPRRVEDTMAAAGRLQ